MSPTRPSQHASAFRRLLVADNAQPYATLYDLGTGQRVDSLGGLPGPVSHLYSAKGRVAGAHFRAQGRVAAAHLRAQHRVAFIDGGAYLQGDRGVLAAPRMLGTFSDSLPTHGNHVGDMMSAFFDGSSKVGFWREADLASGNTRPMLTVNTGGAHHGAGMAKVGAQYVSASVPAASGTSPDGVVLFDMQGQRVDSSRTCPGLHGLAGNASGAMYGCADGALLVAAQNGRGVFTKFTRPDDPRFGVGTVWAADDRPNFLVLMSVRGQPVGAATRALGVADVASRELRPIPLLPAMSTGWRG